MQCSSFYMVSTKGRKPKRIRCGYSAGHCGDGSHCFAYHTARNGKTLVVWTDSQAVRT